MTNTEETDQDSPLSERPNKSALKREAAALRELGETLLALNATQRATVPLSKEILKAMDEARGLKHRDARKRQLQFIGKLLGKSNLNEIRDALAEKENKNLFFRQKMNHIEKTLETLIAEGDSELNTLLIENPDLDRQHLRQLIRQIRRNKQSNPTKEKTLNTEQNTSPDNKKSSKTDPTQRKLFNYLMENLN